MHTLKQLPSKTSFAKLETIAYIEQIKQIFKLTRLEKLIKDTIPISTTDINFVLSLFESVNLKKEEHFLEIGKRCTNVAFVHSGVLRMYHIDDNCEEATHYFPPPYSFVTSHTSLNNQSPSTEGIQAITEATLYVISKKNLETMYRTVPAMQEVGRKATEQVLSEMNKRISLLINNSAERRYEVMLENSPILLQTVPLQHIASYLGITPQHLSRIRKKIR